MWSPLEMWIPAVQPDPWTVPYDFHVGKIDEGTLNIREGGVVTNTDAFLGIPISARQSYFQHQQIPVSHLDLCKPGLLAGGNQQAGVPFVARGLPHTGPACTCEIVFT